jgi:hypothetical protein
MPIREAIEATVRRARRSCSRRWRRSRVHSAHAVVFWAALA